MRNLVFYLLFALLSGQALALTARDVIEKKDFVALRVYARKFLKKHRNNPKKLKQISGYFFEYPEYFFDLIHGYDARFTSKTYIFYPEVGDQLKRADDLLLGGKFIQAYLEFQKAAKQVKKSMRLWKRLKPTLNRYQEMRRFDLLYQHILHHMGRSLYSAKKFQDAEKIYDWIEPNYPHYRQIMFEKMWNYFRLLNVGKSLGSVASQRSAYFSKYLEPEAYLIQLYLYKRLCRKDDLLMVNEEVNRFYKDLKSNKFRLAHWVGWSPVWKSLYLLLHPKYRNSSFGISPKERINEQRRIYRFLNALFQKERRRLLSSIENVRLYSSLAVLTEKDTKLKPIRKLQSRSSLLARGYEIWPGDSAEEWIDEVGQYEFIGDSECKSAIK